MCRNTASHLSHPEPPKRRAAFLDRDGTVLKSVAYYLTRPSEVELEPGAAQALRLLRQNGFLIIIVTNQAGVAKGLLSEETLAEIHRTMRQKLAQEGAHVDAIYYCPHHPEGLIKRYSGECDCRKPKPGLLLRAARELNIDLKHSVLIGDAERDILAGKAAGCRTYLITNVVTPPPTAADHCVASLLDAAQRVCDDEV